MGLHHTGSHRKVRDLDWLSSALLPLARALAAAFRKRCRCLSAESSIKQNGDIIKTSERNASVARRLTGAYFNIHLGALGLLRVFGLGVLAQLGDVLDHLCRWTRRQASVTWTRRDAAKRPSHLSEGLSFVLLASVLCDLLQSRRPLGPLFHLDQAGQQTHQQEENQQAQQGDDGHVQSLQLVRFRQDEGGGRRKGQDQKNSDDLSFTYLQRTELRGH